MDDFQRFLEIENPPEIYIPFHIPIKPDTQLLSHNLVIPYIDKSGFKKERPLKLSIDTPPHTRSVEVNLMPRVQSLESPRIREERERNIHDESNLVPRKIPEDYLEALNWVRIYRELMKFKRIKEWDNLIFSIDTLKSFITINTYTLWCPIDQITPIKFRDLQKVEDVVIDVLKAYLIKFYAREKNLWGKEKVTLETVDAENENIQITYIIEVRKDDTDDSLVREIEDLIDKHLEKLNKGEINEPLKNVYFDRHLYQPLLAKYPNEDIRLHPAGLNPGEKTFIDNLSKYVKDHKEKFNGKKLFVLRNLPKKGAGFYDITNFFPDFVIWATDGTNQNLLFVDPKGLGHITSLGHEKIQLCFSIKDYEEKIQLGSGGRTITLNSAILSWTKRVQVENNFRNPPHSEYDRHHVYFMQDDVHYIEKLLKLIQIV